jgi:hypothetical protein
MIAIHKHEALMRSYWTTPSAFKRRYFSRNLSLHRWQLFSKVTRTEESACIWETHLFQFRCLPESCFCTHFVSQVISNSDQSIRIRPLLSGTYLLPTTFGLTTSSSSSTYGCWSASIDGLRIIFLRAADGGNS